MRELIYIPMVHDARFGNKEKYKRWLQTSSKEEKHLMNLVLNDVLPLYWKDVNEYISGLKLHRIYVDGYTQRLVDAGYVHKLSKEGDIVDKTVEDLMKKGAVLMPTEHPQLMILPNSKELREKDLNLVLRVFKEHMRESNFAIVEEFSRGEMYYNPVKFRDNYIAKRIETTLKNGERGILFMGYGHSVDEALKRNKSDIKITRFKHEFDLMAEEIIKLSSV
jgi:hypothetical protein